MEKLENSLFYNSFNNSTDENISTLKEQIITFVNAKNLQVFLLDKILGLRIQPKYDIQNVTYVLIPNYPILIIFENEASDDDISDYIDDLKEDIGKLSTKHEYDTILDRPRKWKDEWFELRRWEQLKFDEFVQTKKEKNEEDQRKIGLLISLMTGSINEIKKIGISTPTTILDKVKRQIMLFDGKQSHFIFDTDNQNRVVIQGMAGTGKTELFMRKIKELYVNDSNTRIAFTCHNRVLANEMKLRINSFFNILKVEEQIDWETRLKVFRSWGSMYDANSGLYRYICKNYDIPFFNFSQVRSFDTACKDAINQLENKGDIQPLFDYIFIDESQDFENSFFELCQKVCRKTVYIAGDIFQSIFDNPKSSALEADYTLNKCYRTDPRTLMFAHSIGMGLFENPPLNWLKDEEWEVCGYKVNREKSFQLTREPIRRFEDVQSENSIILQKGDVNELQQLIINNLVRLKEEHPTITPDDVGIILISDDYNHMVRFMLKLQRNIKSELDWNTTNGIELKRKIDNSVYISNENNVKGLEFPFTLTVVLTKVSESIKFRNSLYMSLTRSFITSYLLMDINDEDNEFFTLYKEKSAEVLEKGLLELKEPTAEEIKTMKYRISLQRKNETTLVQRIDFMLSKDYPNLSEFDRDIILKKVQREWYDLNEDIIMDYTKQLAKSLSL